MLTLRGKVVATLVIVGMNLLVALILPWFVVLTAIPSAVLLWAILRR